MLLQYSLFPIVPKSTCPKRRFEIPMGKVFPLHIEPGLNHQFYHQITWIFVHRPKSFINFGKNKAFEFSSFVIYQMCPNPISPISTENWWKSSLKISSCEEITVFKIALFSLQCVTTWMGHWHRETYFQKTNLPPSAEYMTLPLFWQLMQYRCVPASPCSFSDTCNNSNRLLPTLRMKTSFFY